MMSTDLYVLFQPFVLLIGLVIGSFLNVCIQRLPEDRSLIPNSACESCGTRIHAYDLIPVASYLLLRGKCRHCDAPIGGHIPLIEALTGLVSWLVFVKLIPDAAHLDIAHLAAWGVYFGFCSLLIVLSYVDIKHRIIPDQTSIYAIPFGFAAIVLLNQLGYDGWLAIGWRQSVLGALFAGGFFKAAAIIAKAIAGYDTLGLGDVKLVAMFGAFLGVFPGVIWVMMLGSILGSVVGIIATIVLRRRPWMPFGPALAAAAMFYVLYGDVVVQGFFPVLALWSV